MKEAASIIARLEAIGASIRVEGLQLIVEAPTGAITPDLRAEMRRYKSSLVAALQEDIDADRQTIESIVSILATAYERYIDIPKIPPPVPEMGADQVAFLALQSVHGDVHS